MNRPNFEPIFTQKSDFCEKSSPKPVETFVPHQAMSLSELISRFERGQRLNVHQNFKPMDNFTDGTLYVEDFEDAPPDDVHDVVDVHNFYLEHKEHKKDFAKRQKEKKAMQAQQASAQPAQPADPDPTSADPAH